ncbi:pyridoxamine 5'-phosphate oxidase family protein [Actinomadura pelletieri DSM 43383]|uniref:Pyridoxamine 5'-phosphate oxidase family protein n=1 Tax=Actinomadura pelletieri DSM 43383 TaxID=1120940 RepID=A0A495QC46_9ACTN|nr:PPOX class F420-dependent oxidoreductase [Actinomadura pelletieri]RKS69086.1 pyridoxamine 5'-phosphate oxidase family protein [Actinomadura pelletieri DSM 43383]
MFLTDIERDYLATQRLGRLATVGPKGDPQNNPVGYTYNADIGAFDIRGWNLTKSRKYRNIAGNDQVALVIDDLASVRPWHVRGIEIRGRAETLVEDPAPGSPFGPDLIRVHPHTIFTWGLDPAVEGMAKRTAA